MATCCVMVLAPRTRGRLLAGLLLVVPHRFADRLEIEAGVEREELVLGGDHRHGRVRRDLLEIHPAVVGLVVSLAGTAGIERRVQHEGAVPRVHPAHRHHRQRGGEKGGGEPDERPSDQPPPPDPSSHYLRDALVIITSAAGTFWWPERVVVATLAILSMTSMPEVTLPNTA